MLGAAIEGLGLAQLPEPIAAGSVRAGKLVQVLEPFAPVTPGVFLYYPSRRQIMPKLRAFIDHVKSRTANERGRQLRRPYFGGFSSPASHPLLCDFIGSSTVVLCTCAHLRHSKVRRSV